MYMNLELNLTVQVGPYTLKAVSLYLMQIPRVKQESIINVNSSGNLVNKCIHDRESSEQR